MTLSPRQFLSNTDMEEFASDFLGLSGVDADMYYEAYYQLNTDDDQYDEEDEYRDETQQSQYTY